MIAINLNSIIAKLRQRGWVFYYDADSDTHSWRKFDKYSEELLGVQGDAVWLKDFREVNRESDIFYAGN